MYQKLQQNCDIIQYLVKNASPEQWTWHQEATERSLGEIVCHLRDVEIWHARIQVQGVEPHHRPPLPDGLPQKRALEKDDAIAAYEQALEEYSRYRRQTLALLQNVAPDQWHCQITHRLFGQIALAELVARIDEHDRTHIRQIEANVHKMPFNPLLARAVYEIDQYYRRYQPYLAGAGSVLDIGVGPGLALRYVMLQNPLLTFAGVDVRDLRLPRMKVPLVVYDGQTLPFGADQFDVSLIFYVLHHCLDPQRVLSEAVRVTCQKLIVIEEFDLPDADAATLDLTERQSHRALGIPPDLPYQLFDKVEFEEMLRVHHLVELEQQLLPSGTTRPVQKYLYVLEVKRGG